LHDGGDPLDVLVITEVIHFLNVYKDLESAEVEGKGWDGLERAYEEIEHALQTYQMSLKHLFG
jgi:inorganic pyrophosphatase